MFDMKVDVILCGDAMDTLKSMPERSVDLIVTSPPYNYGMKYDEHDDDQEQAQMLKSSMPRFSSKKR